MIVVGALAALVGVVLFHVALGMALRQNAGTRIPFFRSPEINAPRVILLRSVGAGLLVLGAVLLSSAGWYWPVIVVLVGPGSALGVIVAYNVRTERRPAS